MNRYVIYTMYESEPIIICAKDIIEACTKIYATGCTPADIITATLIEENI